MLLNSTNSINLFVHLIYTHSNKCMCLILIYYWCTSPMVGTSFHEKFWKDNFAIGLMNVLTSQTKTSWTCSIE